MFYWSHGVRYFHFLDLFCKESILCGDVRCGVIGYITFLKNALSGGNTGLNV